MKKHFFTLLAIVSRGKWGVAIGPPLVAEGTLPRETAKPRLAFLQSGVIGGLSTIFYEQKGHDDSARTPLYIYKDARRF